jgi:hypothetical protein
MDEEYKQINSFEVDQPETVAVGKEAIVLGTKNRLEVIQGNSRSSIDISGSVIDVAVAENIFVLTQETLTAYSTGGNPQWSADTKNGIAVSATVETSVCGLLTNEKLHIYDSISGDLKTSQTRSEGGGSKDTLLSTPQSFIYKTWSFLTAVDNNGDMKFELDMEAVINDIGYFSDLLIVSLQNNHIVAVDPHDGSICWKNEFRSPQVPPYGDDEMFITSENGILEITTEGESKSVSGLPDGSVYMTRAGGVVYILKDDLISRYIRENNRIEVDLINESVGIEGAIEVNISNPTNKGISATFSVSVEGCELYSNRKQSSIDPNKSEKLSFQVKDIDQDKESELNLSVDGTIVYTSDISLQETKGGLQSVSSSLAVEQISDSDAIIQLSLINNGKLPVDEVEIIELDDSVDSLDPDEEYNRTVRREYQPNRSVSVGYRIAREDREREFAPTCELPPEPTISAETEEDALKAKIDSPSGVEFTDQLVIELPGAKRVRTDISFDDGPYNLIIPKYKEGVARIALDSLGVENLVQVSGTTPLVSPTSNSDEKSPFGSESQNDKSKQANSSNDDSQVRQTQNNIENNSTAESKSIDQETPANNIDQSSSDIQTSENRADKLNIEREFPSQIPATGHLFLDRVKISNKGEQIQNITLVSPNNSKSIQEIDSSSSIIFERFVSILDRSKNTLPEITIQHNEDRIIGTNAEKLEFQNEGISVKAVYDSINDEFLAHLENHDSVTYTIESLNFASKSKEVSIDKKLPANESAQVECETPHEVASVKASIPVWLHYSDRESERSTTKFLAYNPDDEILSAKSSDENMLDVRIGADTNVSGEYRSVVLEVINPTDNTIEDVSVEATGNPVHDSFYSKAHQDELQPNDEIHHYIDIEETVPDPQFTVELSFTIDESHRDYEFELEGPVLENEDDWKDKHVNEWSVTESTSTVTDFPEVPDIITTEFHKNEN